MEEKRYQDGLSKTGQIQSSAWSLLQACLSVFSPSLGSPGSQGIYLAYLGADPERQSWVGKSISTLRLIFLIQWVWGWGPGSSTLWLIPLGHGMEQGKPERPSGSPLVLTQNFSIPAGLDTEPQSSCTSCTWYS